MKPRCARAPGMRSNSGSPQWVPAASVHGGEPTAALRCQTALSEPAAPAEVHVGSEGTSRLCCFPTVEPRCSDRRYLVATANSSIRAPARIFDRL